MITAPKTVLAERLLYEIATDGHSPLVVKHSNKSWIVKSSLGQRTQYYLANEVICSFLLQIWGFYIAPVSFVIIENHLLQNYKLKYNKAIYYKNTCVGIELLENATEINGLLDKSIDEIPIDFDDPLSLLKLGLFDIWVENDDRKPSNANLLIFENAAKTLTLLPIDHAFTFNSEAHRNLNPEWISSTYNQSILNTRLAQTIAKKQRNFIENDVKMFFFEQIKHCEAHFDDIISSIPAEWQLNQQDFAQLKAFLFNETRNNNIISEFQSRF